MGHVVDIYTMKWWDEGNTYVHEGITYHAICRLYPLYTADRRRSIREGVMFGISCLKMLRHDFDIIETDHMPYFPLFFTKMVTVLKRKPLYATWHEVVGLTAWKKYLGPVKGTIAYIVERTSIILPDHVIAVSKHTQNQIRDELHYKGKLSLVSNGIDLTRIKAIPAATETSDIIYVGRLVLHKHVDLLIKAVALLKISSPYIRCVVIGDGPEYIKLSSLVKEMGLTENVIITGRLESSDDVYAHMKASKIFISPSTREGFGITILEAFACGLSVVVVNHKDNLAQYLVTSETGIVCDLLAPNIARAAETLLNRSPGPSLAVDTDSYDWDQQASALERAYGL
jgi:glycosyltransferase involved in cell wall biosynthesis